MKLNPNIEKQTLQILESIVKNNATNMDGCGLSYEQFRAGTEPALRLREERRRLKLALKTNAQETYNAEKGAAKLRIQFKDTIRSHPQYGPNSALYVGAGFVADNARASGMKRPRKGAPVLPLPPEVQPPTV